MLNDSNQKLFFQMNKLSIKCNFFYYLSNGLFYFIFPNFLVKCNFFNFNIDVAPEIRKKFRM